MLLALLSSFEHDPQLSCTVKLLIGLDASTPEPPRSGIFAAGGLSNAFSVLNGHGNEQGLLH